MQYSFTALAMAAAISMTSAYTIADIPSCALTCVVTGATAVGCSPADISCACKKADALSSSVTPCVASACPADAQAKVITVLEGLCKDAGVPVTLTPPTASTSAAPASSAAPATSASSVASSASSVASSASSAASSATSAASSATSSAAASSSGYASASTGAPVAQPTSGVPYNAAGKVGVSMGAAGAMLAAALYAL